MMAGNAGGGWTCYESALSPDPAQAKSQAKAFWHCKLSSSEFWEARGGHHFFVIHISPTPPIPVQAKLQAKALWHRKRSCSPCWKGGRLPLT